MRYRLTLSSLFPTHSTRMRSDVIAMPIDVPVVHGWERRTPYSTAIVTSLIVLSEHLDPHDLPQRYPDVINSVVCVMSWDSGPTAQEHRALHDDNNNQPPYHSYLNDVNIDNDDGDNNNSSFYYGMHGDGSDREMFIKRSANRRMSSL